MHYLKENNGLTKARITTDAPKGQDDVIEPETGTDHEISNYFFDYKKMHKKKVAELQDTNDLLLNEQFRTKLSEQRQNRMIESLLAKEDEQKQVLLDHKEKSEFLLSRLRVENKRLEAENSRLVGKEQNKTRRVNVLMSKVEERSDGVKSSIEDLNLEENESLILMTQLKELKKDIRCLKEEINDLPHQQDSTNNNLNSEERMNTDLTRKESGDIDTMKPDLFSRIESKIQDKMKHKHIVVPRKIYLFQQQQMGTGGDGGMKSKIGYDLPMKSLVDSSVNAENEMSTVEDSLVMRNLSPAEEDSMTEDYGFSYQEESEEGDTLGEGSQNKETCVSSPQEKKPTQRSLLEKYGNNIKSEGLEGIAEKDVSKSIDSCVPQLGSTESMSPWNNILSCFAENPNVLSDRTTSDETIVEDETRDQMNDNNKNNGTDRKTDKHLNSAVSHLSFTIGGDDSNDNDPIIAKTELIHESKREIELTNLGKKKDYYISTN
eukprot:CAMPEP_0194271844 /NCGR_PEP_ID=MMETSP0169-20130528/5535_1 /TAXON_ID=218684 /ORGANISM="Corethron pennatum, Strain L29A3" /LENGTH=489 /DNA_ID=CAMNT_0039014323 /DNA_START=55 /DNA_END=1524 /DNA_ORIENTATION=-